MRTSLSPRKARPCLVGSFRIEIERGGAVRGPALHQEKLVLAPGDHLDSCPGFDATSEPAADWFAEHLLTKH